MVNIFLILNSFLLRGTCIAHPKYDDDDHHDEDVHDDDDDDDDDCGGNDDKQNARMVDENGDHYSDDER